MSDAGQTTIPTVDDLVDTLREAYACEREIEGMFQDLKRRVERRETVTPEKAVQGLYALMSIMRATYGTNVTLLEFLIARERGLSAPEGLKQ